MNIGEAERACREAAVAAAQFLRGRSSTNTEAPDSRAASAAQNAAFPAPTTMTSKSLMSFSRMESPVFAPISYFGMSSSLGNGSPCEMSSGRSPTEKNH